MTCVNPAVVAMLARHTHLFGTSASWHCLETGHGKGPCDGVGGAVKKLADNAMKKNIITDTRSLL